MPWKSWTGAYRPCPSETVSLTCHSAGDSPLSSDVNHASDLIKRKRIYTIP
jgi:hypothetical protein